MITEIQSKLSFRYIEALRQLPQFLCASLDPLCLITHALTGAQLMPPASAERCDDGFIEIEFPGGRTVEVVGSLYFQLALKEAAEIEFCSQSPDGLFSKSATVQQIAQDLSSHLRRKHSLP